MLVAVEGVDGSGKTTLIENLRHSSKEYFWVMRASGPPNSPYNLVDAVSLIAQSARGPVPIVLDRHPLISEPIYGPRLRQINHWDQVYPPKSLQDHLCLMVDRIIYCRPPLKTVLKEVRKERQLDGVVEGISLLYDLYDQGMEILEGWGIKVVQYDWTLGSAKGTSFEQPSFHDLFFGKK